MIEVSALNHSTLIKYRYFGEGMSVLGFGRRPTLSQVICMLYEGPMRMIEVSALNHSKLVKMIFWGRDKRTKIRSEADSIEGPARMIEVSTLNHSTLVKYRYFGEGSVLGFGRRSTLSVRLSSK
jgi:hypothetical protein